MKSNNKSQVSIKWNLYIKLKTFLYKLFVQSFIIKKNSKKKIRFLEIGPGEQRINDFETLNIIKTKNTDYVGDSTKKICFSDNTFDILYASHILEHAPWYLVENIINEWARIIKPNGKIEIWVPDSLKIAKAFYDSEFHNNEDYKKDGWYKFNDEMDPTKWFSGRIFSYGDGLGTRGHFNFHMSAFSERYLFKILEKAGFSEIKRMDNKECRGYDHGWINLGVKGIKNGEN